MKLRVGACLLLLCASACDARGAEPLSGTSQALQTAPFGRADRLDRVRHGGVRLVEFFHEDGTRLAYRERVFTDGEGRFSIDYTELVEGQSVDGELFGLLQQSSQGFLHRYRDFAIRSSEGFDRNYTWAERGESTTVAARRCRVIEVTGIEAGRGSYRLALDKETGIILSSEERDESGRLLQSVTYESFDSEPDLAAVEWHSPVNREQALDPHAPLLAQLGVRVLEPRLLPGGYTWSAAATVADGSQQSWLKLTYTDGVRTVFFLQRVPASDEPIDAGAADRASLGAATGDLITVYPMGAVTVAQGRVAGVEVIALGRVPESELLSLIESALP